MKDKRIPQTDLESLRPDITKVDLATLNNEQKTYLIAAYAMDNDRINGEYIKPYDLARKMGYKPPYTEFNAIYHKMNLKGKSEIGSPMATELLFEFLKDQQTKVHLRQERLEEEVALSINEIIRVLSSETDRKKDSAAIASLSKTWVELRKAQTEDGKLIAELIKSWLHRPVGTNIAVNQGQGMVVVEENVSLIDFVNEMANKEQNVGLIEQFNSEKLE